MAIVPVYATNIVVGTNAVSTVTLGPGFSHLEVVNLDGGGHVGYRFDTTTSMTSTNALESNNWTVPKSAGAGNSHELGEAAPGFYVELCASNTVALTSVRAWA